jgi:hypothetical protein
VFFYRQEENREKFVLGDLFDETVVIALYDPCPAFFGKLNP